MDRNHSEPFRGHEWFETTALFRERCDGPAFDPKGERLPLGFFEPMVRRVFAVPRASLYAAAA